MNDEPFVYRRLDHFKQWLSIVKQHTTFHDVPHYIVDKVRELLKGPHKYTYTDIGNALEQLDLQEYCEQCDFIYSQLQGVPELIITPKLEEALTNMFIAVNKAFSEKLVGLPRKSFFPYRHPEYIEYYARTTHPIKRKNNEDFFAAVCSDVDFTSLVH